MATTLTAAVKGMHCASCAAIIEKTLKKTDGVGLVQVNYGLETATINFDETKVDPGKLSKAINPFGYSLALEENQSAHSGLKENKDEKLWVLRKLRHKLMIALPIAGFSLIIMGWDLLAAINVLPMMQGLIKELVRYLLPLLAIYIIATIGRPFLAGLGRFLRSGHANMDTLIGLGTSAAFLYSLTITVLAETLRPYLNVDQTYFDVTIVVIIFISLGKYLEARSKLKTGDAIEKLLNLQAKTALVIRDGQEQELPIEEVVIGDLILVKPGGRLPVDGVINEGLAYIDESMITGEPLPVTKHVSETVSAGTINTTTAFTFKATKVGGQTLLAHIIKMVGDAQASKAPIQALADKISAVFVPIVLVLSFVALGAWLIIGSQFLEFSQALSYGLVSFVGILVIACPCALGLATPTAIIVGVGKGAREGILIKDAATLQKLYKVDTLVVDKTGTLTQGRPTLATIHNFTEQTDEEIIVLLASLEKNSEHPIAQAIINHAQENNIVLVSVKDFKSIRGQGVTGIINDKLYSAGRLENNENLEKLIEQHETVIVLKSEEKILALITVADQIKQEAKNAITQLHKLGIEIIMATGDRQQAAEHIAEQIGVDNVIAEVFPEKKLEIIKKLQSEGKIVAMAGDGVNDAPALAQADVGIAMATGTDVAIESAGITLLYGDITKIAKAIHLSKLTMRGIKQNLFWAFIYNIVGIPLAGGLFFPFFGWLLNPIFAGLAMGLSSVSVVSNSLRLKTKKL